MPNQLPSLPSSEEEVMQKNRGARDFWSDAVIERIEDKPMVKCEHEFIAKPGGVECKKCHFGFPGSGLEIREGKLFFKGEQLPL